MAYPEPDKKEVVFIYDRYGDKLMVTPNKKRIGASSAYIYRDSAEPELNGLEALLRPDDVFVDCGANIGIYSIKASSIVGDKGRVISIEPGHDSVRRLENNLEINVAKNISVVNKAVSDKPGVARLYHSGEGPVAYSLVEQSGADYEEVMVTTLDDIAAGTDIHSVDCIKIDVEGAEAEVLAGATTIVGKYKPTVIFEINSSGTMRSGVNPQDAWDMLHKNGYSFFNMERKRLLSLEAYPEKSGNVVAIARKERM